MKALLYYNIANKSLTDGSSDWAPETLTFGESLTLGLRFKDLVDGEEVDAYPQVAYLKAAMGPVDNRPVGGTFRLQFGGDPAHASAPIEWNAGEQEISKKINAMEWVKETFGECVVKRVAASLLLTFGDGATPVQVGPLDVELIPHCTLLTTGWRRNTRWFCELRLVQSPVAFADSSERVLPPPPAVAVTQEGGSDGVFFWNTVQQFTMPPEFRGTFQFRRGNVRTAMLSRVDGVPQLQAALAVFGEGIAVEQMRPGLASVEFGGEFKGQPVPALEIFVVEAPEGDLTFTLALDRPELFALLRQSEEVALPFEIELGIADPSAEPGLRVEKIRTSLTVRRGLIFDTMATAQGIDWLRPVPRDYVPFTADQIIVGQRFHACPVGDGGAVSFVIDHNLATPHIASVLVRRNDSDGQMLAEGRDYGVAFLGDDSLRIDLTGAEPPGPDALAVVICAAGDEAHFQAHTHTMEQVVGLFDALDQLSARVSALEVFVPGAAISVADGKNTAMAIEAPLAREVLFLDEAIPADLALLSRPAPYLLPAVHTDIIPGGLVGPPLPGVAENTAGLVWRNQGNRPLLIPGGGMIRSSYVEPGGFLSCDVRMLFPVEKTAGTSSYYPAPFGRLLWEIAINDRQLRVNRVLTCQFAVAARLVHADSEAQWVILIERGEITAQAGPGTPGVNVEGVVWSPVPLLAHRFLVTGNSVLHRFGCRIARAAGGLSADRYLYGEWEAALENGTNAAPPSANFALRARLARFDTKNNVQNARSWLFYEFGGEPQDGNTTAIREAATFTIA